MSGAAVEVLVLDVHGVVLNNPLQGFLARLAALTGQDASRVRLRWEGELRDLAWKGGIDDDELWRRLAGAAVLEHDWRALLEDLYEPGPVAPFLEAWSERAPIWLLSNHRSHWLEPRLRRLGLLKRFDRVLVSDVIGAAKPESAAFLPILERLPSPGAALFVDDRARNIAAARGLGIRAVELASGAGWRETIERELPRHRGAGRGAAAGSWLRSG